MEMSPLPLVKWFLAIELLLTDPAIATAEVSVRIGIHRNATVRRLIKKIEHAITSPEASKLLAGLDAYFGGRHSA
jgi:hypothetical protein